MCKKEQPEVDDILVRVLSSTISVLDIYMNWEFICVLALTRVAFVVEEAD
jgi:hypothetical protein